MGTVSAKARQLKRSFQGVDDPVQLADDMATFGEWIEKSFQKWVEEGQDRDDGETLITRIQSVGRAPEILRQFAPVLHKF